MCYYVFRIGCVMMNEKGFTLIELMSVIILLAILLSFAVFSYSRYLRISKDEVLKIAANSAENAALEAFTDCQTGISNSFCVNHPLPTSGNSDKIFLNELVDNRYIEAIVNPYNKGEYCDLNNSYVEVTRKVVNIRHKNSDGTEIDYGIDNTNI